MMKRKFFKNILMFGTMLACLMSSPNGLQAQNFANWPSDKNGVASGQPQEKTDSLTNPDKNQPPKEVQTPSKSTTPAQETSLTPISNTPRSSAHPTVQNPAEPTPEQILQMTANMQNSPDNSRYTLGANDILEITVARHPEVSGQYAVNAEGKIQYEFVGDLPVQGLTKDEVKNSVAKALEKYIVTPDVTVKIVGYNSKVVYVIGEVATPGKIFMRGDTITVREALMQAGLPLLSAATRKSRLFTPSEAGKPQQKNINVEALLYEGDLRENLVMKPGDTLYIPPTFMAKAMRVINPVAQPIGTAAGTARTAYPGF